MTIKDAIDTVTFELGELPACTDEACDALDYIEDHYENIEEVVRCKDCKKFGNDEACPMLSMQAYTEEDDYCSSGERKQDGNDR